MKALKFLLAGFVALLLLGSTPPTNAGPATGHRATIVLVDPTSIPNLYFETDLTPIHVVQVPGQPAKVVRGWGWGYDFVATFADAPTNIEPLGLTYSNGEVTGRSWSGWGIPGDVQKWKISNVPPPEYPHALRYMTPNGGIYTGELVQGVIPSYNLTGDTVIRALAWFWKDGGKINVKTWQVAVGHLASADNSVYVERTVPVNSKIVWAEFKGGQITDTYLTKADSYRNADGWTMTRWALKSVAVKNAQGTVVLGGSVNYMESTPYDTHPWYTKYFASTWDPARLIGQTICPYSQEGPVLTTYLWDGPCE